jgi:hypothetical protein
VTPGPSGHSGTGPGPWRAWALDGLALALLALLALIFFWPVTLNQGWIPRGGGDLVSFLWPTYSYAAAALHAGRLPLWDPALYSGAPLAADNQSGLFYPVNLLVFLAWPSLPYQAMEWLVVFHVWLAGAGMFLTMRAVLSPGSQPARAVQNDLAAALAAAVAYMFSDIFVTHVGNLNIIAVSAWLPLAFAALHLSFSRGAAHWAALAGMALGLAALAGHAQMTLIVAAALGLYGAWRTIWLLVWDRPMSPPLAAAGSRGWLNRQRLAAPVRTLALTALAFMVALGISAIAVIPAAEMAAYTARARLDYAAAAEYSLPWAGLAGLFSPLIFGRGGVDFWAPWARVETGYAGVLTLLLAALAPFRARRGLPLFLVGLAAFGLLAALGQNAPLHRLLYDLVPGFAQLRVPARFVLLTDFSLAALAGLGLSRLAEVARRRLIGVGLLVMALGGGAGWLAFNGTSGHAAHVSSLLTGLGILAALLLAGLGLALWAHPRVAAAGIVALLAIDLIGLGAAVEVERSDPTQGFNHPAVVAYLLANSGPTRIDNAAAAWSPDAAARLGLEDIGGISNPLALAAYQTYAGAVGSRGTPLYNFLSVQFVLADKGHPPGDSSFVPVYDQDPSLDVYLNTNAQPRIRLVYQAKPVAGGESAFGAIHAPGFDPAVDTVLDTTSAAPPPAALDGQGARVPGARNLFYTTYAPEAYTIVATTAAPAYLVYSEVWYPGWRAWVDGVEVPIYRADFAFRAVYLSTPGQHTVVMRFEPITWKIGLALTLATLAALAGWGALASQRRGRR